MGKPLIFNIQKYSIHDGGGIRTTVFFKGCPLSCLWCHNPESQSYRQELLFHDDRCTGCGACVKICPHQALSQKEPGEIPLSDRALCQMCISCVDICPHNAREEAGKEYDLAGLIKELEKDRMFYERSGGGITLSGGEPLAQDMDYIEELAKRLHQKGYSVNIDTSGYAPYENFRRLLPYANAFLYDLKLLDAEAHKKYTGVDNILILDNLVRLNSDGGRIYLRLPLIEGVNAHWQHIDSIIRFLKEKNIRTERIHLLKYHDTGRNKYKKLGIPYKGDGLKAPGQEWLEQAAERFRQNGFQNIQIGG